MSKLTKTQEIKLMIIENFIEHYTTNDDERDAMKMEALTYVEEDHVDEIAQADFVDNSARKNMQYKRSNRIVSSLAKNQIPDSISTTPYMIKKHKDIKKDLITQNEVKGLFNCMACHKTADKGIYGERDINIPNFGRWKD